MTMAPIFLVLVFLFSLISKWAEDSILTGPLAFAAAGLLVALALPQQTTLEAGSHVIQVLAELTLAIVLFRDATHISLREVTRESRLPLRLLAVGMPLSILLGAVVAALLIGDSPIWEAAILAVILAPTDASLGPPWCRAVWYRPAFAKRWRWKRG